MHAQRHPSTVPRVMLASAMMLAMAGCGHRAAESAHSPFSTPSWTSSSFGSGSTRATSSTPGGGSARCIAANLAARVATFGSEMSQPFLVISLTNQGTASCHLRGYPVVSMVGKGEHEGGFSHDLRITVHHGSIYERSDPSPGRVELTPRHTASFALGTATAWDGRIFDITQLAITPPGTHTPLHLKVTLMASAPTGEPIPVGVTALHSGEAR